MLKLGYVWVKLYELMMRLLPQEIKRSTKFSGSRKINQEISQTPHNYFRIIFVDHLLSFGMGNWIHKMYILHLIFRMIPQVFYQVCRQPAMSLSRFDR